MKASDDSLWHNPPCCHCRAQAMHQPASQPCAPVAPRWVHSLHAKQHLACANVTLHRHIVACKGDVAPPLGAKVAQLAAGHLHRHGSRSRQSGHCHGPHTRSAKPVKKQPGARADSTAQPGFHNLPIVLARRLAPSLWLLHITCASLVCRQFLWQKLTQAPSKGFNQHQLLTMLNQQTSKRLI